MPLQDKMVFPSHMGTASAGKRPPQGRVGAVGGSGASQLQTPTNSNAGTPLQILKAEQVTGSCSKKCYESVQSVFSSQPLTTPLKVT